MLRLNTLTPGENARKSRKRVGRGIGSGLGKTCGRGHKGQKARAGGFHKINFEGGQMPIQRRLPKMGFKSQKKLTHEEIPVGNLEVLDNTEITMRVLKENGLIKKNTRSVKVYLSGSLSKAITVKGLPITKGASELVKAQGGKVEA